MIHDLLKDHVVDVPRQLHLDSESAWRAGRRRRLRARVGAVSVVVIFAALLATTVFGLLPKAAIVGPADSNGRVGVDGYPQRIAKPWWIRDLPERPEPLAGLLHTPQGWLAVSAQGHVWDLPEQRPGLEVVPALSLDGTRLAYLKGKPLATQMVIVDLVTGAQTSFPDVLGPDASRPRRYRVVGQQPSWFSPNGQSVLVAGNARDQDDPTRYLILSVDGEVRPLTVPAEGFIAGWVDNDSVAFYTYTAPGRGTVTVRDLQGRVERTVDVPELGAVDTVNGLVDQWTASLSPQGDRLAVNESLEGNTRRTAVVDLTTGNQISNGFVELAAQGCPVVWRDDNLLVPGTTEAGEPSVLHPESGVLRLRSTTSGTGTDLIVADTRLGVACSVWAADATAGEEHLGLTGTLFGTSDLRLWWYWREALVVLTLSGALLVVRRRIGPKSARPSQSGLTFKRLRSGRERP